MPRRARPVRWFSARVALLEPLCASRHAETEAALIAAMKGSEADRQKIWDAIHDGQNNLKWVIALVVTTLLAAIGALIESFII